ncbi:nuclear transport factor 2 family protein [Amphritea balenae]|uniref:Nuclear transport factor 2 family protein n=1 Tax=Amphritea balenae TaxID=452629 RepID=A0A3P1STN0_9GAMM|nr:nuclear transport factor 2 family protein [Amphritea balenae]RRD00398.1 nuclear transport factor 2 family protein [Amphritea balenae]GGK85782.1 hypothetical protein GCM10007941_40320 [Amphritea balenae]
MLSREEMLIALKGWIAAWGRHDFEAVMALFHEDILFEHWNGNRVEGKNDLEDGWSPWFKEHEGFYFIDEDIFVDEVEQKALYRWEFHWPSIEPGFDGEPEVRRGIDVLHFKDGQIIQKLTYSKTVLEISGKRQKLTP